MASKSPLVGADAYNPLYFSLKNVTAVCSSLTALESLFVIIDINTSKLMLVATYGNLLAIIFLNRNKKHPPDHKKIAL